MATINDIIARRMPPLPWNEGDNIPWHEPGFSERMLAEHLTQDHDLASRRTEVIDSQVVWIHNTLLASGRRRILDVACGPGLYLNRLGNRGHHGVGIDFSPAAVAYARGTATTESIDVTYIEGDVRSTSFGAGFDLVMMLYGQLNVFRRPEAADILRRAHDALVPGGTLLVEPQTFGQVEETGRGLPVWSSHRSGLFSPRPHLLLTESFWSDDGNSTTQRFHVIDADGNVATHAMTTEAYRDEELVALLADAGFVDVARTDTMTDTGATDGLAVLTGRKAP